ncbi:hypothetical protein BD779DRAFT_1490309 [Infundibulicybe gibba]|nr:hypothetical protein BD779DRAFT_1490309 [Infundibulicybe gibba]
MAPTNPLPITPSTRAALQQPIQKQDPKTISNKNQLAPKRVSTENKPATQPPQQKKPPRRSSKPIINWFQRKLAGTVKAKRPDVLPHPSELGRGKARSGLASTRVPSRVASSPLPAPAPTNGRQHSRLDALNATRRKTISLNGDDDYRDLSSRREPVDDSSSNESDSLARESTWYQPSALEADEDASVRPIYPSTPPSPSPSRSSSSYLSDPRTFRSIAASTKPTTILSIDLNGNGMAHIAQAPLTPSSQVNRYPPHIRTSSSATNPTIGGGSITFSTLPQPSSRPSSLLNPGTLNPSSVGSNVTSVQAPLHTTHHPRNNPRPSSPPLDNASMLTLASSAYAMPGLRLTVSGAAYSAPPSAMGAGDSFSHFDGSVYPDLESANQSVIGDDEPQEERDFDASVRALRPRSSRRGSWESEASRWSARVQMGTPSLARERSLWTTNSGRTGGFSDTAEFFEKKEDTENIDQEGVIESDAAPTRRSNSTTQSHSPKASAVPDTRKPVSPRPMTTDTRNQFTSGKPSLSSNHETQEGENDDLVPKSDPLGATQDM